MKVTILAIGDELLSGRTLDTNSHFLSGKLAETGGEVLETRVLRDEAEQIEKALRDALSSSDMVITTGGLGPTTDDLTRFSVAKVAGRELKEDSASIQRLEERARAKGRELYENGRLQALFPEGSKIIENPTGTANSFITEIEQVSVFSLPGVPRELKYLTEHELLPFIAGRFPGTKIRQSCYLHCFGYSESWVGSVVEGLEIGDSFNVAYRPDFPEIMLTITGREGVSPGDLEKVRDSIEGALAGVAYSSNKKDSLEEHVSCLLRDTGQIVAIAESCTGGLLSSRLVAIAGASEIFSQGLVTYSNSSKVSLLGVSEESLNTYGAVSSEVAREMAKGLLEHSKADFSLVTTGIAGPGGGSEDKPVGTVYIGIGHRDGVTVIRREFPYSRSQFRQITASSALDLLRRKLSGLELEFEIR